MKRSLILAVIASILTLCLIIGCAGLATKKEQADYAFNKEYKKYKAKRPPVDPVRLNYDIISLIPGVDDKKFEDINEKVKYLSMIYKLSTIYTDIYFENAEFENYKIEKTNEWRSRVDNGDFTNADFSTVSVEYEKFLSAIGEDQKYIDIIERMKIARADYIEKSKELGEKVLIEMIKKYLNVKDVMAIRPKAGMSFLEKGKFLKSVKKEATNIGTILSQGAYTVIGTGLVVGQATTTLTFATIEVAGVVVKITVETAQVAGKTVFKVAMVATDAAGQIVTLAMRGGALVIEATGEVVLEAAKFAEDGVMNVGGAIGNMTAVRLGEKKLYDASILNSSCDKLS